MEITRVKCPHCGKGMMQLLQYEKAERNKVRLYCAHCGFAGSAVDSREEVIAEMQEIIHSKSEPEKYFMVRSDNPSMSFHVTREEACDEAIRFAEENHGQLVDVLVSIRQYVVRSIEGEGGAK